MKRAWDQIFCLTLLISFYHSALSTHLTSLICPLVTGRDRYWSTPVVTYSHAQKSAVVKAALWWEKTSVPPWLCCFFLAPRMCFLYIEKKNESYLSWKLNLLKIKFPYWNNINKISTINLDCTRNSSRMIHFGRKRFSSKTTVWSYIYNIIYFILHHKQKIWGLYQFSKDSLLIWWYLNIFSLLYSAVITPAYFVFFLQKSVYIKCSLSAELWFINNFAHNSSSFQPITFVDFMNSFIFCKSGNLLCLALNLYWVFI